MDIDRTMIGLKSRPYTAEVNREHAAAFAAAIGDDNPLYSDEQYAGDTAYKGTTVPPTYLIALGGDGELPIQLDYRRMLHGEQEFIYHRPVRYGDRLECTMSVTDIYEREGKSGTMQFLVLDTEMKDEEGQLAAITRNTIIYRPAQNKEEGGGAK